MRLNALEQTADWLATVEYHGSRGRQTLCLLHDRLTTGGFYWIIADHRGVWPWDAVRNFDPVATARMVVAGKIRLVKGQWPRSVGIQEEGMQAASVSCQSSLFTAKKAKHLVA